MQAGIPLSLYIHIPWCVEKCPYCDFNSHALEGDIPEQLYIAQLFRNLEEQLPTFWGRRFESIFIGGGTPSLFSGEAIEQLLSGLRARLNLTANIEITMESNPGTADAANYAAYRQAGINRLSIGVQSLQPTHLKQLGRIHSAAQALDAIGMAKQAGFERINADLMFGLGEQTLEDALGDLQLIIDQDIEHISWYQLTIEPNTHFYSKPPAGLPDDDRLMDIQDAGTQLLIANGYKQYEISAWSRPNGECRHNINYWSFGDYIGIGAGAHGKITDLQAQTIFRTRTRKQPHHWLRDDSELMAERTPIATEDLALEFFLNGLRLNQGVPRNFLYERTGLHENQIQPAIQRALELQLIIDDHERFVASEKGRNYLNDLVALFMPDQDIIIRTSA